MKCPLAFRWTSVEKIWGASEGSVWIKARLQFRDSMVRLLTDH